MAFKIWVDDDKLENVTNILDFETQASKGFQSQKIISAKETNSAVRQANLISVAFMNYLGVTDKNMRSSVSEVQTAIAGKIDGKFNLKVNLTDGELANTKVTFTAPDEYSAIASGDATKTIIGKITKRFSQLGSLANKSTITASELSADAVETAKIKNANVTTAKIEDKNVTTGKLADLSVTTGKLADLSVTTGKLADLSVTEEKLATNAVTTNKIKNSAITSNKIATGAVTGDKLAGSYVLSNTSSVRVGNGSSVGSRCVSIGENSYTGSNQSVAVGYYADGGFGWGTAIGSYTKTNASGESYMTAIGYKAEVHKRKSTAIGYNAKVTSNDSAETMRLGATDLSALKCAVALTTSSDTRDKADINTIDSKKCLDIISQVEPIQYVRNDRDYYIDSETKEFDQVAYSQQSKKGDRVRVGVKAQQLKQVLDTVFENDNHSDIVYDNHYDSIKKGETPIGENKLEMSYSKLVPILIGAIQELQKEIEELKKGEN